MTDQTITEAIAAAKTNTAENESKYGPKPTGFDALWLFVPNKKAIVCIWEGCGDNLTNENIEEGYHDYAEYQSYILDDSDIEEDDGGCLLTKYVIQEKCSCLADLIPNVLDALYDDETLDAVILV